MAVAEVDASTSWLPVSWRSDVLATAGVSLGTPQPTSVRTRWVKMDVMFIVFKLT